MYTSGALILTDDGEFIYKITHPKHEITKTYVVTIKGKITKEEVEKLEKGVDIGGFVTSPANVKILRDTRLQITIKEGKNRQIRKMCDKIEKEVLSLHRNKIGKIDLKGLKIGEWRHLTNEEVNELKGD